MNNIEIDYLKWKIGIADGLELKGNLISVLSPDALWTFDEFQNDEILSSFLTQRACEYCGIYLRRRGSYHIAHYCDYKEFPPLFNPEQAKEIALKYVHKQETNNE